MEQFLRALNALAQAGLLIQVVGAAMLWLLFHIIRRQVSDRRYFRFWTVSWGFFALAFLALAIRYRLLTTGDFNLLLAHEDQPLVRALYATYQIAKLWGVGFMVVGSLSFNQIRSPRWPVWMGALACYAIISLLAVPTFEGSLALQAALVTPLYAFAAWPFLRATGDRSLGRMLTGVMLVALAALWAVYGINYASSYWSPEFGRVFPTPFAGIMPISTLLDTVGMILLAFGMVLVLTEDLRLETDNYRTVLSERLAQTQKMEAVGRLVSGVAHELNNPLAAILAFSEEMLSEFRPPREREALEVIRDQSRRARTIVRDLLTFVGRREERWEQLTPASLLERVAKGVAPEFQRRGASLEIAIAADCPIIVADRAGLEQVVTNLLSNAAYAAGPGGKVVLGAQRTAENGLRITVTDNGPGVLPELRPRLFEPFFTTKPAGQGTGLGLSVSLGVVEQHHGTIEIESPSSGGARFVVTLPQGTVPAPAVTPTTTVTPAPRSGGAVTPSSVLVIDDEASVRMAMRRWFERMGWTVDEAVDGAQGLALLLAAPSESTYGLVLCDLRMPGMSGIELHTRLLEQRPGVIDRIIFATGDTASPETAAFLARVERPVLEKPFELSQLAAVVEATAGVR